VVRAEWAGDTAENAQKILDEDLAAYLRVHQDEIEALTIFFSQPYRRHEVTYAMIHEVLATAARIAPSWPRCASGRPTPSWTITKGSQPAQRADRCWSG
jgi:hypothetical protein